MQPAKVSIVQLMANGTAFYVPFYQRPYVWKKNLWDRFIKDMEDISSIDEEYFIGSTILKKRETKGNEIASWTIVDGQQRITTLALFFKIVSLKDKNAHNPFDQTFRLNDGMLTINHSMIDSSAYEKIANKTDEGLLEGGETSNLIRAFNYMYEHIDISKINVLNIKRRLWFIAIYLEEKENEHKIFDTINSIGLRLNTEQLLKNYLFTEDTINEYKKIWKPVFEADEKTIIYWSDEISIGKTTKTSMSDIFFEQLLQIIMYDPRNKLTGEEKREMKQKNDEKQFSNYQKIMQAGQWDNVSFASEITAYAKIFRELFVQKNILKDTNACKTPLKRILLVIFTLDVTTALPYVIYVVRNCQDEDEKNRIFTLLESYLVRRKICNKPSNNYSDLFTETLIGKGILTYDELLEYLKTKKPKESLHMPYNVEVENAFSRNTKIPVPKARVILYLLESSLRKDEQTILRPLKDYTLEHLMPQDWEEYWPISTALPEIERIKAKDERSNAVNVLGNMGIITNGLNAKVKNYEWERKLAKGLKKKASGILILESAINSDTWDELKILDRAEELASYANEVWKNDISSDDEEEAKMFRSRMDEISFFSMGEDEFFYPKDKRKPPFKFSMVDLKPGDIVQFDLDDIEVEVASDDKILYQGEEYYLSEFCKKFDPTKDWKSYQGSRYFSYEGKTLYDMRAEREADMPEKEPEMELVFDPVDENIRFCGDAKMWRYYRSLNEPLIVKALEEIQVNKKISEITDVETLKLLRLKVKEIEKEKEYHNTHSCAISQLIKYIENGFEYKDYAHDAMQVKAQKKKDKSAE